jgi:hypothetical protein
VKPGGITKQGYQYLWPIGAELQRFANRVVHDRPRGYRHFHPEQGRAKLTAQDVRDIRRAYSEGATVRQLSEKYGFRGDSIRNVLEGKNYAWVI